MDNVILIAILGFASCTDFKKREVSNLVPVILTIWGILNIFAYKQGFPTFKEAIVASALAIIVNLPFCNFELMGFGDVKLLFSLSFWFGFEIIDVYMLSFIVAVFIMIIYIIKNKTRKQKIPFGPAIAVASLVIWFSDFSMIYKYLT